MKKIIESWAMRFKESRTILTVGMWGIITATQVIQVLKPYLSLTELAMVLISMIFGGVLFSYWYSEFVMKGEEKQRQYRKGNFIDPRTYIYQQIDVAQMAVQSKAIAENWDISRTRQELEKVTEERVQEFLDGVDVEEDLRKNSKDSEDLE